MLRTTGNWCSYDGERKGEKAKGKAYHLREKSIREPGEGKWLTCFGMVQSLSGTFTESRRSIRDVQAKLAAQQSFKEQRVLAAMRSRKQLPTPAGTSGTHNSDSASALG